METEYSDRQESKVKDASQSEPIKFKPKKRKMLRTRESIPDYYDEEDQEEESNVSVTLQEMRTVQKLRRRQNGVSVVSLALGKRVAAEETSASDPFKVKTGGMIDMNALKSGKVKRVDDAYDTGIGTQFSAETNKRDEDEEMMKYIEEELSKRKGQLRKEEEAKLNEMNKYCSPEEAALQAVPDHLRASSTHRSEEMLSNQMLSGIPEVDLGIDAKIRNIEATEEAKLKLLWERHSKKDAPSQFVPTNMAVNFVQHNRFNIEDPEPPKCKDKNNPHRKPLSSSTHVGPSNDNKSKWSRENGEKATDDYHYERFKKQFRRY